jgi:hypothetical protein
VEPRKEEEEEEEEEIEYKSGEMHKRGNNSRDM